jgi:hypothetical protein
MILGLLLATAATGQISANNPLAWLPPTQCETIEGVSQIDRRKAIGSLLKEYPVSLDASAFDPATEKWADRIAKAECPDGLCKTAGPLAKLRFAANDIFEARETALFKLEWVGEGPEPVDERARTSAFYDLGRKSYRLVCKVPEPKPEEKKPSAFWTDLAIASSTAETEKGFAKRDPSKVSYRADRQAGADSATVKVAVVTGPIVHWKMKVDQPLDGSVRLFTAYDRLTNNDPAKVVNNLDFGAKAAFVLDGGDGPFMFGVEAAWQTDDDFKSSLERSELFVRPGLKGLNKTGYGHDAFLTKGSGYTLRFSWDLRLLVDHVEVKDPGDKPGLLTKKSFTRGGYDLDAGFRLRKRASDPMYALTFAYKFRDDWSGRPANADRFNGKLQYSPTDASHFVFGLEYDRGEDLTAFSSVETWLLTFGYRR